MSPDQGGAIDYCIKNIKRGIRKRKSMEGDDHQAKTSKAASSTTESPTAVRSTTSSETPVLAEPPQPQTEIPSAPASHVASLPEATTTEKVLARGNIAK